MTITINLKNQQDDIGKQALHIGVAMITIIFQNHIERSTLNDIIIHYNATHTHLYLEHYAGRKEFILFIDYSAFQEEDVINQAIQQIYEIFQKSSTDTLNMHVLIEMGADNIIHYITRNYSYSLDRWAERTPLREYDLHQMMGFSYKGIQHIYTTNRQVFFFERTEDKLQIISKRQGFIPFDHSNNYRKYNLNVIKNKLATLKIKQKYPNFNEIENEELLEILPGFTTIRNKIRYDIINQRYITNSKELEEYGLPPKEIALILMTYSLETPEGMTNKRYIYSYRNNRNIDKYPNKWKEKNKKWIKATRQMEMQRCYYQ